MEARVSTATFDIPPAVGSYMDIVSDHRAQKSILDIANALGNKAGGTDSTLEASFSLVDADDDDLRIEFAKRGVLPENQDNLMILARLVRTKKELAALRGVDGTYQAASVVITNTGKEKLSNVGIIFESPAYIYGHQKDPVSVDKDQRISLGDLRPGEAFRLNAWMRSAWSVRLLSSVKPIVFVNSDEVVAENRVEILAPASSIRQLEAYRAGLKLVGMLGALFAGALIAHVIGRLVGSYMDAKS
ncbi:MAG: hypothetical protein KF684_12795 [Phycisphaeraceae bacterium]|nr:hypothetical protein [Phycisphaeraceae bacterium]